MAPPKGFPKPEGSGRKAGQKNHKTKERLAAIAAAGVTPLEYMLAVMRDKSADWERRDWAAAAAANYVHPKLSSATMGGDDEADPISHQHTVRWLRPGEG